MIKDEEVEAMAEKEIKLHPYPEMTYPAEALTKISRKSWVDGYKKAIREKEEELLQWVDEKLLEVKADMSQGWRGEDLSLLLQRRTDLDFFKKKILSLAKQPNEE